MTAHSDPSPMAIKRIAGTAAVAVTGLGLILGLGVSWLVLDDRGSSIGTGRYMTLQGDTRPPAPATPPSSALIDRETAERLTARLAPDTPPAAPVGRPSMAGRPVSPPPAWSQQARPAPPARPATAPRPPADTRRSVHIAPAWSLIGDPALESTDIAASDRGPLRPLAPSTAAVGPIRLPAWAATPAAAPQDPQPHGGARPVVRMPLSAAAAPLPSWMHITQPTPEPSSQAVAVDPAATHPVNAGPALPAPWMAAAALSSAPTGAGNETMGDGATDGEATRTIALAALGQGVSERQVAAHASLVTLDVSPEGEASAADRLDLLALGDGLDAGDDPVGPLDLPDLTPPIDKDSLEILTVSGVDEMARMFAQADFSYQAVRDGDLPVPRLLLANFPEGIEDVTRVDQRKGLFFNTMLPIILQVNEAIAVERARLVEIQMHLSQGLGLTDEEEAWLEEIATHYESDPDDIDTLLTRVDIIPPSMALGQGAVESGWGTSRLAREGNALFGQITSADSHLVNDDGVRFAAFETIYDSVAAYARNLNTHPAYADFRAERAAMRAEREALDGYYLMGTLEHYSELGQEYIAYVRRVMRANGLAALDDAELEPRFTLEASL